MRSMLRVALEGAFTNFKRIYLNEKYAKSSFGRSVY